MNSHRYSADDWQLIIASESRIDAALAKLFGATKDVADATRAQAAAVEELKEARIASRALRARLDSKR